MSNSTAVTTTQTNNAAGCLLDDASDTLECVPLGCDFRGTNFHCQYQHHDHWGQSSRGLPHQNSCKQSFQSKDYTSDSLAAFRMKTIYPMRTSETSMFTKTHTNERTNGRPSASIRSDNSPSPRDDSQAPASSDTQKALKLCV